MTILSPTMLYDHDYSITVINALRQYWKDSHDSFSCIGAPKSMHMLLYLDSCKAEYTLKDGRRFEAKSGSIVYTPKGSEYSVRFSPKNGGSTVGVNLLFHHNSEEFCLSDSILVFDTDFPEDAMRFEKLCRISTAHISSPAKLKAVVYDILADIGSFQRFKGMDRNSFAIIRQGISFLENDVTDNVSVRDVAAMCNVSESYFRRLFKEYAGVSPTEYRLRGKIAKAKELLTYEDLTVSEVADRIGIADATYFAKLFKERTGCSPTTYRKEKRQQT